MLAKPDPTSFWRRSYWIRILNLDKQITLGNLHNEIHVRGGDRLSAAVVLRPVQLSQVALAVLPSRRMLPVRSPVLPESRLTPAPFHKYVPTHPEHIGIGQHSTELAVYLHYFCKLWIRLPEERSRTQDCLFRLDAAAIGCQVERFACEPVAGTAVRPVLPSLQGNPRRRVDQIKVEPSVLVLDRTRLQWIPAPAGSGWPQRAEVPDRQKVGYLRCRNLATP